MAQKVRCAVYTRKSSEEGLEQEFNSLHAQREACEAFIASQKHEGWKALSETYDDGGFSGGNMDRPALQELIAKIRDRCIDVVVVYKVDRLTRSLADFAKIVEVLDANDASFVSVTQQFNTTTSMGRLTLNVLLSFAQFEREVTGERIRDKIAASKKKGMWMGGTVPLGYDVVDRKLVVNDAEAKTVRKLFRLYFVHGSVRRLREEAARLNLGPKRRADGKDGISECFGFGQLYYLLSNPTYTGNVRHKSNIYPGEHKAIIGQPLWEAVQAKLAANHKARRLGANAREPGLLTGLLADADGNRFAPNHAVKCGKRYRYYVERSLTKGPRTNAKSGQRLPAGEIERVVIEGVDAFLMDASEVTIATGTSTDHVDQMAWTISKASSIASEVRDAGHKRRRELLTSILRRVVVAGTYIDLEVEVCGLRKLVGHDVAEATDEIHVFRVPIEHRLHRGATKLILTGGTRSDERHRDPVLIKALVRAHDWWAKLLAGNAETISDLAVSDGVSRSYVSRGLRLVFLAPDIVDAIMDGTHHSQLTAKRLINGRPIPMNWADQRRAFGMTPLDA